MTGVIGVRNQVIDVASVHDFADAIALRISREELAAISGRLRTRSEALRDALDDSHSPPKTADWVLSSFFGVRRRRRELLAVVGLEDLWSSMIQMADDTVALPDRLGRLSDVLVGDSRSVRDFPYELAHALNPVEVALWTGWVWDDSTETGAIRLLCSEDADLYGSDDWDTFVRVNEVSTRIRETLVTADLAVPVSDPFTFDVLLAGVYAVYSQTILQMKMTKEFGQLLPDLGEFMQRILGVYKMGLG
ncbi:MAG: hypothetical protein ACYDHP_12575 [Ferrimicrobium sp.]